MSARTCSSCTLCCRLVPVKEIGLPSFTPCPHLRPMPTAQPGCGIYPRRPFSCRQWSCLWLKNLSWNDELRPERCGVVFDEAPDIIRVAGREYPCMQGWVRPGLAEDFWRHQPIQAVVLTALDQGLGMLFRRGPRTAFAIWRDADGVDRFSPSIEPQMLEPDGLRLRRAERLIENLQAKSES
jgi:hypothetical protein